MRSSIPAADVAVWEPPLPAPRGPLSEFVVGHLPQSPHPLPEAPKPGDAWDDDDFQLALYTCYELHYRGFAGVDERWEWSPDLLAFRSKLEDVFEAGVTAAVGPVSGAGSVEEQLWALARDDGASTANSTSAGNGGPAAPSLSAHVAERATLEQVREVAVHRSAYQLKEADPHTWAIPRLSGAVKAAMVDIQADEYGGGVEAEMHSTLFAVTMRELGLDDRYGSYLDWIPGPTLATVNLITLFGLHRRLRAALVGHLAIFEMTSVVPMSNYAKAMARLGVGHQARQFYEVHVDVDDHHQVVAARDLAGRLAHDDPDSAPGIMFGARAAVELERRFADCVLEAWAAGRSSLRLPLPPAEPA